MANININGALNNMFNEEQLVFDGANWITKKIEKKNSSINWSWREMLKRNS